MFETMVYHDGDFKPALAYPDVTTSNEDDRIKMTNIMPIVISGTAVMDAMWMNFYSMEGRKKVASMAHVPVTLSMYMIALKELRGY